jgi:hypothetical protein
MQTAMWEFVSFSFGQDGILLNALSAVRSCRLRFDTPMEVEDEI